MNANISIGTEHLSSFVSNYANSLFSDNNQRDRETEIIEKSQNHNPEIRQRELKSSLVPLTVRSRYRPNTIYTLRSCCISMI